jgi:hypothetical protein
LIVGARVTGITIYEFDALIAATPGFPDAEGLHAVPDTVYGWLEDQCFRAAEQGDAAWLRLTSRSCSTRNNRTCDASGNSPISSKNNVPPLAASK